MVVSVQWLQSLVCYQVLYHHILSCDRQPLTTRGYPLIIDTKTFQRLCLIIPRETDCINIIETVSLFAQPGSSYSVHVYIYGVHVVNLCLSQIIHFVNIFIRENCISKILLLFINDLISGVITCSALITCSAFLYLYKKNKMLELYQTCTASSQYNGQVRSHACSQL